MTEPSTLPEGPMYGQTPSGDGLEQLVDLAPQMFGDVSGTVINYLGENYYKACGAFVRKNEEGGNSTCVFPARFEHEMHMDYRGNSTEKEDSVLVTLTAQPKHQADMHHVSTTLCDAVEVLMQRDIQVTLSMYPGGDGS